MTLAEEVWNIQPIDWSLAQEGELSGRYLHMLLRWVRYAETQFAEWTVRPNCGHFFGGCFGYGMDTSFTSAMYAVLSKVGDYDPAEYGVTRRHLQEQAIKGIRYLCFTHGTGPADCVRPLSDNPFNSGKKWGTDDEDFFRATQTGQSISAICLAARFLWAELDRETKLMLQTIAASYADRWCKEPPRAGTYNDTQEEENAWTANGISAAMETFPDHPNRAKWRKGFIRWALSSILSYKDTYLEENVLPARTRRTEPTEIPRPHHVTIHADYTTENHGFVHPDYLKSGINLRAMQLIAAWAGGRDALSCTFYNNELIYEQVVLKCIQEDGIGIPVQGQDWYYMNQYASLFTHAVMNVVHENPDAARIEREALARIEAVQQSHTTGCLVEEHAERYRLNVYQTLKHYETMNIWSLTLAYMLHLFGGNGPEPSDTDEMMGRLCGVHHYPYGNVIVHRTKDTFNAFNWRSNVMGFSLPKTGIWSLTPMFNNYTGVIELEEKRGVKGWSNENRVRFVDRSRIEPREDGFGAAVSITRGDKEIRQDVAFVSLPDGRSVYMERIGAMKDCRVKCMQTGIIGVRNESYKRLADVAKGSRTLYFPDGSAETFRGFIGESPDEIKRFAPVSYLNVDDRIGYIVSGSHGIVYENRHVFPKYVGVENVLVLNERPPSELRAGDRLEPFLFVALPNRSMAETEKEAAQTVRLACSSEDVLMVETGGCLAFAHFGQHAQMTTAGKTVSVARPVPLYDGHNRIDGTQFSWSGRMEPFQSGFFRAEYMVEPEGADRLCVEAALMSDRLILTNSTDSRVQLRLNHLPEGKVRTISIAPHSYAVEKR